MQIIQSRTADIVLFFRCDRLFRCPEPLAAAIFHFYKKKYAVLLTDQIDLTVPIPEIAFKDLHPFFAEKADCLLFSPSAGLLPRRRGIFL